MDDSCLHDQARGGGGSCGLSHLTHRKGRSRWQSCGRFRADLYTGPSEEAQSR